MANDLYQYEKVLIHQFVPACMLVNEQLQVVHTNGNLAQFFSFPDGLSREDLLRLIPDSLQPVFHSAIRSVKATGQAVVYQDVSFPVKNKVCQTNIKFSQVYTNSQEKLLLIEFDPLQAATVGQEVHKSQALAEQQYSRLEMQQEKTIAPLQVTSQGRESAKGEVYWQALLNNIPDAIIRYDKDLRIVYTNKGFELQSGIPSDQVMGKQAQDITTLHNKPQDWIRALQTVLQTRQAAEHTSSYQTGTDEEYYLTIMVPEINQEKNEIESVLTISRNITALKQYEFRLKKSEQQWKSLLDNTPDIILRFDKNLNVQYANTAAEQELGISARELMGKTPSHFESSTDNLRQFAAKLHIALQTGELQHHISEFERADGKRFYLSTIVPEYDTRHIPQTLLVISRNITEAIKNENEMKQSEALIKKQNEELHKVNEYLDNFVYAVAHDLRSPVANLQMLSQLLDQQNDPARSNFFIQAIQDSVNRLDKTLNGLVEVLEIQSVFKIHTGRVQLSDILLEVKGDLKDIIDQSGCSIQANFENCPSAIYIRSYLVSIFKNLISNAIKYREETRPVTISILSEKMEDMVLIRFEDNGAGIDLKRLGHKLFKPFSRLTNQGEGKGIGLYLIKNMVEKNGGRLEVESILQKGTLFKCFLKEYNETTHP